MFGGGLLVSFTLSLLMNSKRLPSRLDVAKMRRDQNATRTSFPPRLDLKGESRNRSLVAIGFYGPNNQIVGHMEGLRVSSHCGVLYEDATIWRHFTRSQGNKETTLSQIFATGNDTVFAVGARLPFDCFFGFPPPVKRDQYLERATGLNTVLNTTRWVTINAHGFTPNGTHLCALLRSCKRAVLYFPYQTKLKFVKRSVLVSSFSNEVHTKALETLGKLLPNKFDRFFCLMLRLADKQFGDEPLEPLRVCDMFNSSTTQCILNYVEVLRRTKGDFPVLLLSSRKPSRRASNIFKNNSIFSVAEINEMGGVFVDEAVCSLAFSVVFVDDMSLWCNREQKCGGSSSTLYRTMSLFRKTTQDVSWTELLRRTRTRLSSFH